MRILVVDDEPIARARMIRLIRKIEGAEVVGEAGDGIEALSQIRALDPDVVLLDIDMPRLDGLAVAEDPDVPPVVFTTAHTGFALDAFEADAVDYLLKPISLERLTRALDKVSGRVSGKAAVSESSGSAGDSEPWRLVVAEGSLKRFVDAREVDCFTADQKYVAFRLDGGELLARESLDTLEERLRPCGFLRVNRGALVRRDAVVAYDQSDGGSVMLRSGDRVAVSRRAVPAVRAALGITR